MTTTKSSPITTGSTSGPDDLHYAINEVIEVKWTKDWASTDRGDDVWYTPEVLPSIVHVEFHMDFTQTIEIPKEITGVSPEDEDMGWTCPWTAIRGELVAYDKEAETLTFAYQVIAD